MEKTSSIPSGDHDEIAVAKGPVSRAYSESEPHEKADDEPVKLVGKATIVPAALPSHDLSSVDEEVPVKADKKRSVRADDVRQVAAPCVQYGGGTVPVALIPSDVSHEGILPGGTGVIGKAGVIAARALTEDGVRAFHLVLTVLYTEADAFQIIMCMPEARMNKFANSGLHTRYSIEVRGSNGAVKNRKAIEPTRGDGTPG
ncbi:hypothetical protein LA080_002549 [Diaporthe eres]|nr:hypothetical protein LA080_002549 [Diaporthe eres]